MDLKKSLDSSVAREEPAASTQLSRRSMLTTVGVAAGAVVGLPGALAQEGKPPAGFGAPLVELHVPAAILTPEQKAAMIKGVTDVVVKATNLPSDQINKLWVQIFETTEGGWGFGGQVFVPRKK